MSTRLLAKFGSHATFVTNLPYESEILRSFVELVYISHITFDSFDGKFDEGVEQAWQVRVVNSRCANYYFRPEAAGGNDTFLCIYDNDKLVRCSDLSTRVSDSQIQRIFKMCLTVSILRVCQL